MPEFTDRDRSIIRNAINLEWFLSAIDKRNLEHEEEGAAHTESYEYNGMNILVPRVRMVDGKAVLNEDPVEESVKRGDFLVVPKGEDPDQYSQDLSKVIGKFRYGYSSGGLSLDNIPFFKRPIGAGKNDQIVGYVDGDKRFPIYQSATGGQYTINLAEDQRTGMQQFKQDTLPVIKNWIKNPTAPSLDQIKEMGKAIASSVYETASIPKDLMTGKKSAMDVTYQDVADIATGVGTASATFEVPEGALRVFGGVGAKKTKNFKEAQSFLQDEMKKINPNNPDQFYWANYRTWKKTGWYIDPEDKQWRFEIDDSASKPTLTDNMAITPSELLIQTSTTPITVDLVDIFKHDKLYKQYPHLKSMRVVLYNDAKDRSMGYKTVGKNEIAINLYAHQWDFVEGKRFQGGINNDVSQATITKTILHELQHSIQEFEGFTRGSNEDFIPRELSSKMDDKLMVKWDKANVSARKSRVAIGAIISNLPKIPGDNIDIIAKSIREADFSGKTGQRKKDQIFQKIVDKYNLPEDSASYKNIKKEMNNIQNKNNEMAGYDEGRLRINTEFYMGAGGEIESRVTESRAYMTETDRAEYFPLKNKEEMLKYEGRLNKPGFRGKEGVDPTQPRRTFEGEGVGQADVVLDLNWRDFAFPATPEGKANYKRTKTGYRKLKNFFKGNEKLEFLLDPKNVGEEFTHNGKKYIFRDISLMSIDKEKLPKNKGVFYLAAEGKRRGKYDSKVDVPAIRVRDSFTDTVDVIPIHEFVEDTQKYVGKKMNDPDESFLKTILPKSLQDRFGFAEGGAVDKQMDELFAGSI